MNETETDHGSTQNGFYAIYQNRRVRIIACALMMIALVWNGARYRARHGFDAGSHTKYADVIAEQNRIPTLEDDVYVYYNPPMFYLYAALQSKTSVALGGNKDEREFASKIAEAKAQGLSDKKIDEERRDKKFGAARRFTKTSLSVFVGIIAIMVMALCGRILGPKSKTAYLIFLMSIPAFFKYPAMFGPESTLTLMVWGSMLVGLWNFGPKYEIPQAIAAGLLGGLAIFTRPFGFAVGGAWGITLIVALVLWKSGGKRWAIRSAIICVICGIAALGLFAWNGKRTGKTMPRPKQSEAVFDRLPLSFYVGIKPMNFVFRPYRDDSPDALLKPEVDSAVPNAGARKKTPALNSWYSILYADAYGDYWKYWTLNHRLNNQEISKSFWRTALSVQMLTSLIPFAIMFGGFFVLMKRALKGGPEDSSALFVPIGALVIVGCAFFLYYAFSTPANEYNQVKALYIHYLLPAIPFGGAYLFSRWIEQRRGSTSWTLPYVLAFGAWSFLLFGIYWH